MKTLVHNQIVSYASVKKLKNDQNSWIKKDKICSSTANCNFLLICFGGLCLTTLLIVAVMVPFLFVFLTTKSETSSVIITTISTTTTTDIPCSSTCDSDQVCVQGVCVGVGYLSFTLTWSRDGDGDLVVATPNNKRIYYENTGPSINTDQGQLDKDDTVGTGPENIFWSYNFTPPTGVYYVCFEPFRFNPDIFTTNPLSVTIKVLHSNNVTLTLTKTYTSSIKNAYQCNSTSSTLLTSTYYP